MSKFKKKLVLNDLQELRNIVVSQMEESNPKVKKENVHKKEPIKKEPVVVNTIEKEEYQKSWMVNKYNHRKMVAKKNRKWLQSNISNSEFTIMNESNPFGDNPQIKAKILAYFNDEKKRKWMLHLITNFLPLNHAKQVPKLPSDQKFCKLTGFELTDVKSIVTGNRDKHIAFTGYQTSSVICGIALNELYKFVIDFTYNFDTREGHIINYAIDELRNKMKK